jgi:hypothetical protein
MMIIKSSFGDYSVEEMPDLDAAIALCADSAGARWLDSQQKKRAMFIIADNVKVSSIGVLAFSSPKEFLTEISTM